MFCRISQNPAGSHQIYRIHRSSHYSAEKQSFALCVHFAILQNPFPQFCTNPDSVSIFILRDLYFLACDFVYSFDRFGSAGVAFICDSRHGMDLFWVYCSCVCVGSCNVDTLLSWLLEMMCGCLHQNRNHILTLA